MARVSRGRRARLTLLGILLLAVLSISWIVALYTDLLWYRGLGLQSVFWTIIRSKVLLAAVFGLAFFALSVGNLYIVGQIMPSYRLAANPANSIERYRGAFIPYLRWLAIGGSAVLALFFALSATPIWERLVLARNAVPFGAVDPLFGRDIGFYVFRLPLYQFLYGWLFSALAVVALLAAGAHYLTGGIRPQAPGGGVLPQVKAHLSVLIGLIALLRAWGYRLDQYELLYSLRGGITGATYTDVKAELPALKLLVVISIIGAILFLVNIRFRGWALPVAGLGLWLLTSVLAAGVFPFVVQRFTVEPAQIQKERPYIKLNIDGTRRAYGLSAVKVREYPASSGITREVVEANAATVDNIRLWAPQILGDAYKQLQGIRPYYDFHDVDVDRYRLDGRLRQVMIASRELAPENLGTARTWQNLHAVYTHGYGAVVSLAGEKTGEGKPEFIVKDIPPRAEAPELEITQGAIYFGEGLSDYSLVRTKQQELDYGTQKGNRYSSYEGPGGVGISGPLRRLAFAWRFRNINLAITDLVTGDSRILYYREINERLQRAAPFLRFDGDPYLAIVDGRLHWIADAYTVSSMYPYAERVDFGQLAAPRTTAGGTPRAGGLSDNNNYIRNSVKATVDAYDGTVNFYVWDEQDPIIQAWRQAFPGLLKDKDRMPAGIREHVRYPEDLLRIQTDIYRRWHMTDPQDFYTNEDLWVVPDDPTPNKGPIEPYYVLMRLPGAQEEEYVLILPMNPTRRQNMVAWIAAKSDPEGYGELIDFRFPKDRNVEGVRQVSARINTDLEFSRERTLLDRVGSRVKFGNLLVIPIEESLLYVQPVFLEAPDNPIPELKNVILATSDKVVLGESLEDALRLLVEGGPAPPSGPGSVPGPAPPSVDLLRQALDHLVAAEDAARRGDWPVYGREQQAAKEALQRAVGQSPEGPSASPSPSPSPSPTE